MRFLVLSLLVLGLFIAGCLAPPVEQNQTNNTNNTNNQTQLKNPTFTITSPTNGQSILTSGESADVTLSMSTQNLILKQPGNPAKAGEGHFKLTVDNNAPVTITSKNYVISGLSLGQHTIKVELFTNDRKSYGVTRQVAFVIEKETPAEYQPQTYEVSIHDFTYDPATVTVKQKDQVTFVNNGAFPRSATCFIDGKEVFDTGVLGPHQNATIVMDQIVNCEYYSVTHMAMKGRLIVESNGVD